MNRVTLLMFLKMLGHQQSLDRTTFFELRQFQFHQVIRFAAGKVQTIVQIISRHLQFCTKNIKLESKSVAGLFYLSSFIHL